MKRKSRLKILIPTVLSFTVFGESAGPLQIAGIALSVIAILVLNIRKEAPSPQPSSHSGSAWQLLLLLFVGGACDSMTKVFEFIGSREDDDRFMFFNFLFAGLYAVFMFLREKKRITGYDVLFGVLLGIPNYFCTRFLLKALVQIPSFIVYPSYSVATVIVISLIGCVFFREKLSRRQFIGIGIILAALVLLNI